MRCYISILANVVLLFAFMESPFLHVHQHESTQRHPGGFLHLHLRSVHPVTGGSEFRSLDPDDDAQVQNWFSASPQTIQDSSSVILGELLVLLVPEASEWKVNAPLLAGHDPPLLFARSPRAPPV